MNSTVILMILSELSNQDIKRPQRGKYSFSYTIISFSNHNDICMRMTPYKVSRRPSVVLIYLCARITNTPEFPSYITLISWREL